MSTFLQWLKHHWLTSIIAFFVALMVLKKIFGGLAEWKFENETMEKLFVTLGGVLQSLFESFQSAPLPWLLFVAVFIVGGYNYTKLGTGAWSMRVFAGVFTIGVLLLAASLILDDKYQVVTDSLKRQIQQTAVELTDGKSESAEATTSADSDKSSFDLVRGETGMMFVPNPYCVAHTPGSLVAMKVIEKSDAGSLVGFRLKKGTHIVTPIKVQAWLVPCPIGTLRSS